MLATVAPYVAGEFDLSSRPLLQARSTLLRQGSSVLRDAADGLGPDPELLVELGEPAETLTSLAHQRSASLLVMAVPGPSAAAGQLGNAHLMVTGTSPCPVVMVPSSVVHLPQAAGPILCGVDGSDQSLAATRVAVELARRLEAPVQLVHVAEQPRLAGRPGDSRPYGERLVASHAAAIRVLLRASQVPQAALDLRVERGRPAERLADIAAREGALLMVTGLRGHGSDHSGRLGSVSSELASTAAQPLVVVPPDARAGRASESSRAGGASSTSWDHRVATA